ncbi:MAG: flagellar assembly protein FliH [Rhodanobacter sp.]|nr:MAG: flagellar assembly protein FliH [Rhodanobacter sp.]TAL91801.1 MAG: flagellar assembly protein FliH [Rhodanobacter sp.]TAM42051.1 MAG: flagellar assembly protein FliH [Rhodanobacter sp.]TAN25768.1 MAG: flagellar assembly protein FliH [Rhodanobacter sp.]
MNVFHSMAEDFQRWELPNLGLESAVSAAAEAAPPPSVHELEALAQQARDEGYAAGLAEGRAAAQQQLRQRLAELDALYNAAAQPLQLLDDQVAGELAQLATVVARRVIMHELKLAPDLIAGIVRQAAAALPLATRELRVYLHPQDLALLQELGTAERHWQLLADPALARGDCRLESARSRLDARVETRLTAIIDAVLGDAAGPGGDNA